MTDTVKHMWDEVEKARADGTFSSEHAAVPAQGENACPWCGFSNGHHPWCRSPAQPASPHNTVLQPPAPHTPAEVVHPDDFAQFLRDVEREQGNCSDEDTWLGYRQTAEAILEKFDVRPKHSSTVGGGK